MLNIGQSRPIAEPHFKRSEPILVWFAVVAVKDVHVPNASSSRKLHRKPLRLISGVPAQDQSVRVAVDSIGRRIDARPAGVAQLTGQRARRKDTDRTVPISYNNLTINLTTK